MGFRKISRDVKLAAIRLHERNLLSLRDILDCCGFSRCTWFRILKLWHETGDVEYHPHRTHWNQCHCHALAGSCVFWRQK
ncbi:uncharacterized protein EDB91DRAFT_1123055 [Suillus paluster]|uniref:uncharacterized protein n=1 Tax=Suillus paluster TaxID=48578 RepID=UPI001B85C37F|nr:uncharacterized protein EDB91DRAFT_1123055 [Suillus paluster]KAG1744563.1 hypothetical protein EDB91DRAFT_1123055 [Suillus paluster]